MNSDRTASRLREVGLNPDQVMAVIDSALAEDLADGVDVTTVATISPEQIRILELAARAPGIIAGLPVAAAVFEVAAARSGREVECRLLRSDGDDVKTGDAVLSVTGATHDLLVGERTALNLLCHLSGVATVTRAWVEALAGTKTQVRDTRKTLPGLRILDKYAVKVGGGLNHRMGLFDEALIKDNHVLAAGGVGAAYRAVRRRFPDLPVEIEVDTLTQLREALDAGADLVLLDNFSVEDLGQAVAIAAGYSGHGSRVKLEASGGMRLADAAAVAATGVDFIAVGGLTHSAPSLDLGADLQLIGLIEHWTGSCCRARFPAS